jgi:soluble lytic murein transglycosylase
MKPRVWLTLLAVVSLGGLVCFWRFYDWRDHSQDVPILAAARRFAVPPALVKAVVWRESRFNAKARGTKGEIGLMQIMPQAAAQDWADALHSAPLTPEQIAVPETNTLIGAWFLARLSKRYTQTDDPIPYTLADYNAGRGNVLKWARGGAATNSAAFIEQIGFPGTKDYVLKVMARYRHYLPIFPPGGR